MSFDKLITFHNDDVYYCDHTIVKLPVKATKGYYKLNLSYGTYMHTHYIGIVSF
jgi:hypothetical protein